MFLILRVLADLLWEYKVISIIINLYLFIVIFYKNKNFKTTRTEQKAFLVLSLLLTVSYFQDVTLISSIIYAKILPSFLMFFLGSIATNVLKEVKWMTMVSLLLVTIHLLMALLNIGFIYWGSVKTFSGLYFFKTDLALAIVIALIFILYFWEVKWYFKFILTVECLYIIFLSNARIHLLSSFLIIFLFLMKEKILHSGIKYLLIILPIIISLFFTAIAISVVFFPSNFLTIDLLDFYSDSNMQGRNHIWDLLIDKFNNSSIVSQFIGLGLTADSNINKLFGASDDVNNAHNGYLYILISCGYLGLFSFFILSVLIIRKFNMIIVNRSIIKSVCTNNLLMIFLSQFFLFFISSFSANTIVFQQQTWFFMFFSGLLYNNKYYKMSNYNFIYSLKNTIGKT